MRYLYAPLVALMLALLSGCASSGGGDHSEFVKSINFSSLDTFSYKHGLVSGFDYRESEKLLLEKLSEEVLTEALRGKGFVSVETGSDFYVIAKWSKAVSSYPGMFDSIDGARDSLNGRDDPSYRFAARMHLTVEIYETETRNLFWRKTLPNIFDANQFTEERIIASLKRAVEPFPERVEKDPNLPSIQ